MYKKILLTLSMITLSSLAAAQEIKCKTEFTISLYKKNALGKIVRDHQGKFNNSTVAGTMSVEMLLDEDRSPYFTYSSHTDGTDRITTYYKAQPNSQGSVNISMNFMLNGKEFAPQADVVLDGERSGFI